MKKLLFVVLTALIFTFSVELSGILTSEAQENSVGSEENEPLATFVVTKTADTNDGVCNSDCSLREAIDAANAAASDDVIQFDPVVFATAQTLTLPFGNLKISNNGILTINGPGANLLTLDGQFNSRILAVTTAGATVTINGIRFIRGNGANSGEPFFTGGGAIYNNGSNLTINS
jgi:CSLREA domain-containing protein